MIPGGFQLIKCSENKIWKSWEVMIPSFDLSGTQFQSLFPAALKLGMKQGFIRGVKNRGSKDKVTLRLTLVLFLEF